jgi:hypothetical protein
MESLCITSGVGVGVESLSSSRDRSLSAGSASPPVPHRKSSNGVSKKFRIYYCAEMAQVAQALVKLDEKFVLSEILWDKVSGTFCILRSGVSL